MGIGTLQFLPLNTCLQKAPEIKDTNSTPPHLPLQPISHPLQPELTHSKTPSPTNSLPSKKTQPANPEDAYYQIEPLPFLDIIRTEPLKLRPFKPTYHMTMAIENTTLSDLVAMDNTFPSRCRIRKDLIEKERYEILACNPRGGEAVLELYKWLTGTYTP